MKKVEAKEVKKRSKKTDFYLIVFNLIKKGKNPMDISKTLKISKQRVQYYINHLKNNGNIKKIGYGTWEVKKEVKTSSLGLRGEKPKTNLHSLQITIPILRGKIKDNDWQLKNKLNNWLPKYKKLEILGGLTIRNNNNKSITIWAKSRDIKSLNEVDNLSFKIRAYINEYMKMKGVILDIFNSKVTNLNIATEDKEAQTMLRKGEKFELDLKKRAEQIFPKDNINAKAWIDGSPFKFTAETNDKEWKREYLNMPFRIRDSINLLILMVQDLNYVSKNYASHVKLVEKASKVMGKLDNRLSQTSLRKWL